MMCHSYLGDHQEYSIFDKKELCGAAIILEEKIWNKWGLFLAEHEVCGRYVTASFNIPYGKSHNSV